MPAIEKAGWNLMTQIRQEVKLRDGKVIVRGQLGVRKTVKSADIVLYYKPNIPLAVIEAKANKHEVGKAPRYYQLQAINKTIEAITRGQDRALLVMATGTGKTYTAFQNIWHLWKARKKKRILFLADRNILVDQTRINDFQPFGQAMTKVTGREVDPTYEISNNFSKSL